jgi:hypothetical protein
MLKEFLINLLKKEHLSSITTIIKKRYKNQYQKIIERTNYLPKNCRFTERIYQIINNLQERPKCYCGKSLNFIDYSCGYHEHCCVKCINNDLKIKDKIKKTMLKRYGVEYSLQSEKIQRKRKKTNLMKYGNEDYINLKKQKETNLIKYGATCVLAVRDIHEKTMESRYKKNYNPYKNHYGNYKGFSYESSWELAFIKFCLNHNIEIERNKKGFVYWFQDKKHRYYPDFYLPEVDQYIEVKADWLLNEQTKEKIKQFPYKLEVYTKEKLINNRILNNK